jgi:hypothetical protein
MFTHAITPFFQLSENSSAPPPNAFAWAIRKRRRACPNSPKRSYKFTRASLYTQYTWTQTWTKIAAQALCVARFFLNSSSSQIRREKVRQIKRLGREKAREPAFVDAVTSNQRGLEVCKLTRDLEARMTNAVMCLGEHCAQTHRYIKTATTHSRSLAICPRHLSSRPCRIPRIPPRSGASRVSATIQLAPPT